MRLPQGGSAGLETIAQLCRLDPWQLSADLHCHSDDSDGTLSPETLAKQAQAAGVRLFALTDHDTIRGLAAARDAALAVGMAWVSGVEISVTWASRSVHVLGLGFDPANLQLAQALDGLRAGRLDRARQIDRELATAGLPGALDGALAQVKDPAQVSRTHFARWIASRHAYGGPREVFEHYLCRGKPGDVPHQWARLRDAVGWIRAAGGVAVLAHPARYRFDALLLDCLIREFQEAGGIAIEAVSGSHSRQEIVRWSSVARQHGMRASRGSDFHGPSEGHCALGQLPLVPDAVEPLWSHWGSTV